MSDFPEGRPLFMSPEHVALMNERLAASSQMQEACGRLTRDVLLAYRLRDEGSGKLHWWQMRFDRLAGVRFALGEPSEPADLTFDGGYWDLLDNVMAQREGRSPVAPVPVLLGDATVLDAVREAFSAALVVARVEVRLPERNRAP